MITGHSSFLLSSFATPYYCHSATIVQHEQHYPAWQHNKIEVLLLPVLPLQQSAFPGLLKQDLQAVTLSQWQWSHCWTILVQSKPWKPSSDSTAHAAQHNQLGSQSLNSDKLQHLLQHTMMQQNTQERGHTSHCSLSTGSSATHPSESLWHKPSIQ